MIELSQLAIVFLENWEIILLFFFVAILYSSVGFGGGSSYLAILTLSELTFIQFRAIALLCNIVVVSGGSYIFYKKGLFNWKKILPLALASIPFAFLGGYLRISRTLFFVLLGITLITAAVLMWISKYIVENPRKVSRSTVVKDSLFGSGLGFLSGMVGIGGGIFLAPLLHLTKWDTPKHIAATASFFILVNSIAGLFGQYQNPDFYFEPNIAFILMLTVFFGGQIGSRMSASRLSPYIIKRMTALLIAFVGLRILWKYLL